MSELYSSFHHLLRMTDSKEFNCGVSCYYLLRTYASFLWAVLNTWTHFWKYIRKNENICFQ